jgi:hypothetical protein
MSQPSEKCHICNEPVSPRTPVIFDHGVIVHLDCYTGAEDIATLVSNFLETRPSEQFCYACLGRHLHQDRQTVEKAITALRLTRKVVIEPTCTICDSTRVTVRLRQEARPT